jgi:hypothetical protein
MSAYLKSIDSKTWKAVMKGWEHPVVLDKDGNKDLGPVFLFLNYLGK